MIISQLYNPSYMNVNNHRSLTNNNLGCSVRTMAKDDLETLADRVRFARKRAHLTQAQLAERVQVSQPMIGKIENGSETSKIVEIAAALGIRPQWLATGEGSMVENGLPSNGPTELDAALDQLRFAARGLTVEQIKQIAATIEAL
ncbi:helix-turn-helix domain-containing protein, partial [Paraburkholderia sp. BR14261]